MATKLDLERDRGVDDPADVLLERKAATKVYLEQLLKANKRKLPPKDTY